MITSEVRSCDCVAIESFLAGSGKRPECRVKVTVPWMNRTNGTEYQDKKYGKGQRLHNINEKKKTATCTCCGRTKML